MWLHFYQRKEFEDDEKPMSLANTIALVWLELLAAKLDCRDDGATINAEILASWLTSPVTHNIIKLADDMPLGS